MVIGKKKTLQSNTNILFCSMAMTDLLVGVVYQPLNIVKYALYSQSEEGDGIECTLTSINAFVLFGVYSCSLCHLTAIAWQRHTRTILELKNNSASRSGKRIKILIFGSWMMALILTIPGLIISIGMKFKYFIYYDTSLFAVVFVSLILIIYYYISIYIKTRKINLGPADQNVMQIAKIKKEKEIAFTTGLLTLALFLSCTPSLTILLLCYISPSFCRISYIFWGMSLLELNSLANPILYSYRNRHLRKAILKLLRIENSELPAVVANRISLQNLQRPALQQALHAREAARSKSWGPNDVNNIIPLAAIQRRQSADV